MADTKIDWCDKVWNPVTGCTKIGAGCKNCYAERMFKRLGANPKAERYYGRTFGEVRTHPDLLDLPKRWKKPQRIFVNSMSDLFHADVPFSFVDEVIRTIRQTPQHTYIVLTKRAKRMSNYFTEMACVPRNLIIGVSCSNQSEVDRDVPILLATPAACRCVSLEPLLGPVDMRIEDEETGTLYNTLTGEFSGNDSTGPKINWVIVGGETGANARPMHPEWVRTVRDQCKEAGVPFFFKQWGEWLPECQSDSARGAGSLNPHDFWNGPFLCGPEYAGMRFWHPGPARAGHLLDGKAHREVPVLGEINNG